MTRFRSFEKAQKIRNSGRRKQYENKHRITHKCRLTDLSDHEDERKDKEGKMK